MWFNTWTNEGVDYEPKYPKNFKPPEDIKKHYTKIGCEECFYTGYKGRKAVYEVIPIDNVLAENIKNKDFSVSSVLKDKGIKQLYESAFEIFTKGETTIEEIYSILMNKLT